MTYSVHSLDIGLSVFACSMTWNRMTCNVLYQYSKSSQTFVALDMGQPWMKRFRCSAVRVLLWAAHCLRRIRMSQNVVSLQLARRCGPRVAVVSHPNSEECRFSAVRAPLWATHWFRCIRMPKNMSMTCCACPKKKAARKSRGKGRNSVGWLFFSIGQGVLIGLCFFYRVETSAPGLSGYYWYNETKIALERGHWKKVVIRPTNHYEFLLSISRTGT